MGKRLGAVNGGEWLSGVLSLKSDGSTLDSLNGVNQSSVNQQETLRIKAMVDDMLLSAMSNGGVTPFQDSLSDVSFLSEFALSASKASRVFLKQDYLLSALYAHLVHHSLYRLNQILDARVEEGTHFSFHSNGHENHIRILDAISQIQSNLTELPDKLSSCNSLQLARRFHLKDDILSDITFSADEVRKSIGVNSFFVTKTLLHPALDFAAYANELVKTNSLSKIYSYRVETLDFFGASASLAKACAVLNKEHADCLIEHYKKTVSELLTDNTLVDKYMPENTPKASLMPTGHNKPPLIMSCSMNKDVLFNPQANGRELLNMVPRLSKSNASELFTSSAMLFSYTTSIGVAPSSFSPSPRFNESLDGLAKAHTLMAVDIASIGIQDQALGKNLTNTFAQNRV